jgi:segregation and condensation protein A
MAINLAAEAIAVLHDLAQRGEIDPWDVQVIDVIDRYLSKIPLNDAAIAAETGSEHLPQSGQAFLWASMLVLLKANTLEAKAEAEEEEEIWEPETLETPERELPQRLEYHIRRRPSVPPVRRRPVTLAELIAQIQQISHVLEAQLPPRRRRRLAYSRREATQQISQLAHDENLNEIAGQLEDLLRESWLVHRDRAEYISLEQLVGWWAEKAAHPPSTHDRVGVFWALLLLCSQSKVELFQREFYQDLEIKLLITPIESEALG